MQKECLKFLKAFSLLILPDRNKQETVKTPQQPSSIQLLILIFLHKDRNSYWKHSINAFPE